MKRIPRTLASTYTVSLAGLDALGADTDISGTPSVELVAPDGTVVSGVTPEIAVGDVAMGVPNDPALAAGVYAGVLTASIAGEVRELPFFFELYDEVAPDFATYTARGGQLDAAAFASLLPAAQAAVDEAIWPNAVTQATLAAYQRAVCAAVDALDASGGITERSVVSEQVGRTQTAYASANVLAMSGLAASPVGAAIRRALSGSGLLYRGL